MEIMLTRSAGTRTTSATSQSTSTLNSRDQVAYLHRLTPGLATSSHAAACASLFGIEESIIVRAEAVSALLAKFEIAKLIDVNMSDAERDELNTSERRARRFLKWEIDEEEDDVESLTQKIRDILDDDA